MPAPFPAFLAKASALKSSLSASGNGAPPVPMGFEQDIPLRGISSGAGNLFSSISSFSGSPAGVAIGKAISVGLNIAGGLYDVYGNYHNAVNQAAYSRATAERNLLISRQQQAATREVGGLQIQQQLALSLQDRLSSALDFSGSSREVYGQEARNLSFDLGTQLFQFDVQQAQLQDQINLAEYEQRLAKRKKRRGVISTIIGGITGGLS